MLYIMDLNNVFRFAKVKTYIKPFWDKREAINLLRTSPVFLPWDETWVYDDEMGIK